MNPFIPTPWQIEELERDRRERDARRPRAEIRLPVPPSMPIDRPAREVPVRGATVITWTL